MCNDESNTPKEREERQIPEIELIAESGNIETIELIAFIQTLSREGGESNIEFLFRAVQRFFGEKLTELRYQFAICTDCGHCGKRAECKFPEMKKDWYNLLRS